MEEQKEERWKLSEHCEVLTWGLFFTSLESLLAWIFKTLITSSFLHSDLGITPDGLYIILPPSLIPQACTLLCLPK